MVLKGEKDKYTIITGHLNIPLPVIDRTCRQKISKAINYLNSTINQPDLIDVHKKIPPSTSSSTAHGPFIKTDHTVGH